MESTGVLRHLSLGGDYTPSDDERSGIAHFAFARNAARTESGPAFSGAEQMEWQRLTPRRPGRQAGRLPSPPRIFPAECYQAEIAEIPPTASPGPQSTCTMYLRPGPTEADNWSQLVKMIAPALASGLRCAVCVQSVSSMSCETVPLLCFVGWRVWTVSKIEVGRGRRGLKPRGRNGTMAIARGRSSVPIHGSRRGRYYFHQPWTLNECSAVSVTYLSRDVSNVEELEAAPESHACPLL